jgi:beta-N-acetylhexosaminidase
VRVCVGATLVGIAVLGVTSCTTGAGTSPGGVPTASVSSTAPPSSTEAVSSRSPSASSNTASASNPATETSSAAPSLNVRGTTPAAPSSPASQPRLGTTSAGTRAQQIFNGMTDAQRVGQLLMIGCPSTGVDSATVTAIGTYHVGSVILDGNSTLSISQEKSISTALQDTAAAHAKLFIATDQEGGLVRRMRGPGFASIPSALVQGGWAPSTLQSSATTWAGQLKSAGINVDLAPVMDTVPPGDTNNPPIGDLDREYGHDPSAVASHGLAVARGFAAAGVVATVKHFPGLGRVTANTDTTGGVTDSTTTSTDAYLAPFAAAVHAGLPFVMISTAIYTRIDVTAPAAFSARIVTGILRGTLGFHGVAISDDLGSAQQVSGYSAPGASSPPAATSS